MKNSVPKYLLVATVLFTAIFCARVNAADLKKQIAHATEIADSFDSVNQELAKSIADSLGEAFGEQEDMDALIARVGKLSEAQPKFADAIAAASTAFIPTDEAGVYAARLAAAAARAVPSKAADIARAVSRQVPSAAGAIANAIKGAVPGANPGQIDNAAQQGANEGTSGGTPGAPGGGGAGAGGGVILPGGGGGGGGGGIY